MPCLRVEGLPVPQVKVEMDEGVGGKFKTNLEDEIAFMEIRLVNHFSSGWWW